MKSDIEIAQAAKLRPITEIAKRLVLMKMSWNYTVSIRPR